MIHSLKQLFGYNIRGTDGEIGEVVDFYFDDVHWTARYVVVDTGKWLPGRKVLLSPTVARDPNWESHYLPVDLTRAQVVKSPSIEADKPVDRQYEELLSEYYGWPVYWLHYRGVKPESEIRAEGIVANGDPHLRSVRDVSGYRIHALDDEIGRISDFIADTGVWVVRYVVVDTGTWLSGRKVLVAPSWVDGVDWGQRQVNVSMSKSQVENSPEFEPAKAVNRAYEAQLYDYYGRPKYW